jgi:hypothetical protein
MDGQLHCSKSASPPNGSYAESCRDIWVQGGVLHAQCRHSNGKYDSCELPFVPERHRQYRGDTKVQMST